MIQNPILPGFNPDPCICRKGNDYYIAVSTFEWMPGIPIYYSKDLKHWELYSHVITNDVQVNLRKLPSAKGIWAPCLTYCESEDLFYIVYGVMNSMNARYFDVDNYLVTAKSLLGQWSEPVYLHSAGFDASILHDDDGRKYIVSLEWEFRDGYEKPGAICMVEYDPVKKEIIGYPKRIWRGGTDRGCIEAPHLTKHDERYYIMCAEGGTGYYHSVTMGRAENPWGPYERDPKNPIVTSSPIESNERLDWDHLKPHYYNPNSVLQKSGHGSYVELSGNEVYLVHLASRPFITEDNDFRSKYCCTLGRETAIQKMEWNEDGWLRMADGSNLAKMEIPEPSLPTWKIEKVSARDDFNGPNLRIGYYSPRLMPEQFTDLTVRQGYLRMRGQESLCSLNQVSLLAKKLTDVNAKITVKMDFHPEVYQHSAGLVIYYDNMNYVFLRKYFSETLGQSAISVIRLNNGEKIEVPDTRICVGEEELYFRLYIKGRKTWFEWSVDETYYQKIGGIFDTAQFSDEYCQYGEFTGTMVGIACVDSLMHRHYADFDYFEYIAEERQQVV